MVNHRILFLRDTAVKWENRILYLLSDDDFENGVVPQLVPNPFEGPVHPDLEEIAVPSTKYRLVWPDHDQMIRAQLKTHIINLKKLFEYIAGLHLSPINREYVLARDPATEDETSYQVHRLRNLADPNSYAPMSPSNFW